MVQSVNRLSANHEVSRSVPSCVTGHGVSVYCFLIIVRFSIYRT